jgi:hypothetical protein
MTANDDRIEHAVWRTEVIRPPRQKLATFGSTNIHYYLLTEPAYAEMNRDIDETVVREGKVIAERPRIITPYYLSHLEGFSHEASQYLDALIKTYGHDAPGLFYTYRNEPKELNIVSEHWRMVADRLNADIDKKGDALASIIKGEDELWDVSLLKFIYEVARGSLPHHVAQMGARGLLDVDASGVPADARLRIEDMFRLVTKGDFDPDELKKELDRWNLFAEYQDRFFAIFRKK